MDISVDIVLDMEERLECPILEMFYTRDDNRWYVCFEEYIIVEGVEQVVHLGSVLEEIKGYGNVENVVNEVYCDERKSDTYFEQVTFEWEEV